MLFKGLLFMIKLLIKMNTIMNADGVDSCCTDYVTYITISFRSKILSLSLFMNRVQGPIIHI